MTGRPFRVAAGPPTRSLLTVASRPPLQRDVPSDYRAPKEQLDAFQAVLDMYVGTHKFHNYTSQVRARNGGGAALFLPVRPGAFSSA